MPGPCPQRAAAVRPERIQPRIRNRIFLSSSLLEGLRAVGQVKGWQTQQIVFVGGTCGSVHVKSFNKNMKALGVLESKWNPIRQKLVRRLLEEQDRPVIIAESRPALKVSFNRPRPRSQPARVAGRVCWLFIFFHGS